MKFNLVRQEIDPDLLALCFEKIKFYKIPISPMGKLRSEKIAPILKQIQKNGIPDDLVVKKLKHNLGHGIFLHPHAKPIVRGRPIAFYTGIVRICPEHDGHDSNYTFSLLSDLRLTKAEQEIWDPSRRFHPRRLYSVEVDAHKKGNFTRFINHSESPNIEAHLVKTALMPVEVLYVTKKTIHPGEQLLVSYEGDGENSYWAGLGIKPMPLSPNTFILNHKCELIEN